MTESLLSIGAFAQAAGLSASTLRHYDDVGLLPAAHVDPVTGYRFYDAGQQAVAARLAVFREAGLPISVMAELADLSGAELADALNGVAEGMRAATARRVAVLHEIARSASPGIAGPCSVAVDPLALADAVDRALPLMGATPFDALLVSLASHGARVWSTDRYRLADVDAGPVEVAGALSSRVGGALRVLLRGAAAVEMRDHLRAGLQVRRVRLDVEGDRLQVGTASVALDRVDDFPDLSSLMTGLADRTEARSVLQAAVFADLPRVAGRPDDVIEVEVGEVAVLLSRELICGAVDTLADGPVVLEAAGPEQAVVVSTASRPGHRIALMPCRR